MRAVSDERVVGVMLPRLGLHPRGSQKNSGNIGAQHVCKRKKVRDRGMDVWGGDICQQLKSRDQSHSFTTESTVCRDTLGS